MSRRFPGLAPVTPILLALGMSACVPRADPPVPAPTPAPAPAPTPTPPPAPAPIAANWADMPPTAGDWTYARDDRGSVASFGRAGAAPEFTLRCDRAAARVSLSRQGAAAGNAAMTIRTTSTTKALTTRPAGGTPGYLAADVTPRDPILDAMGFSRGRIAVTMPALPTLILPSWAEILRVTEDCRA